MNLLTDRLVIKKPRKKRAVWTAAELNSVVEAFLPARLDDPFLDLPHLIKKVQDKMLPVERRKAGCSEVAFSLVIEKFIDQWESHYKKVKEPVVIRDLSQFTNEEILREAGRRLDLLPKPESSLKIVETGIVYSIVPPPVIPKKEKLKIAIVGPENSQFHHVEKAVAKAHSKYDVRIIQCDKEKHNYNMSSCDHLIVMTDRVPHRWISECHGVARSRMLYVAGGMGALKDKVLELI